MIYSNFLSLINNKFKIIRHYNNNSSLFFFYIANQLLKSIIKSYFFNDVTSLKLFSDVSATNLYLRFGACSIMDSNPKST